MRIDYTKPIVAMVLFLIVGVGLVVFGNATQPRGRVLCDGQVMQTNDLCFRGFKHYTYDEQRSFMAGRQRSAQDTVTAGVVVLVGDGLFLALVIVLRLYERGDSYTRQHPLVDAGLSGAISGREHWRQADESSAVYAQPGSPLTVRVRRNWHPGSQRPYIVSVMRGRKVLHAVSYADPSHAVRYAEQIRVP